MTRRTFVAILAAALLLASGAPLRAQEEDPARVPRVSQAEFKALLAKHQVLAIDVRDPHSFEAGHIPGAKNVSVVDLEIRTNALIKARMPFVAYCACPQEGTAAHVALRLQRVGLKDVKVLQGGWDGWVKGGGKVETGPEQ